MSANHYYTEKHNWKHDTSIDRYVCNDCGTWGNKDEQGFYVHGCCGYATHVSFLPCVEAKYAIKIGQLEDALEFMTLLAMDEEQLQTYSKSELIKKSILLLKEAPASVFAYLRKKRNEET